MIGAIVGAGLSAIGSIAGGIASARAGKKQKEFIEQQQQKNQNWYDRRYNEDPTQRADAQRIITKTQDYLKRNNQAVAGAAAVGGATDEAVAQAKEQANKVLADTTSQIAANNEARKDKIEAAYMGNDAAYAEQLAEIEAQRSANIGKAIGGVASAAGSMVGAFDGLNQPSAPLPSEIYSTEDLLNLGKKNA